MTTKTIASLIFFLFPSGMLLSGKKSVIYECTGLSSKFSFILNNKEKTLFEVIEIPFYAVSKS